MSFRIERAKVIGKDRDPTVPDSRRRNVYLRKQSRRRVATVKRPALKESRSDNSNTLCTLVNGVTGQVDGNFSLKTLPSLDALFKIDEMSDGDLAKPRRQESYPI